MDYSWLHKRLVNRILEGNGTASPEQRLAAFQNTGLSEPLSTMIDKVANCAYKITDKDIDALKASAISEDQIFELVICAAVGQATRQYNNALKALAEVSNDKKRSEHASQHPQ